VTDHETPPHRDARYTAFGLTIASEIELPELASGGPSGPADVEIRLGQVAPTLEGAIEIETGITAKPGALLIDCESARYLVRNGSEITISPKPGRSERDIRAYLLGSAIGAICHQRGLLPLHANAVEMGGEAIAFAGPSGAGKSTLAAHFRSRGLKVLCDDVCAISFDAAGRPMAWPGIPRIKLWSDALAAFGREAGDLERVFDREDKFSLPFPHDPLHSALPLSRIFILVRAGDGEAPCIRPLSGAQAFNAVFGNVYRQEYAAPLGQAKTLFANVVSLLGRTQVYAAERTWGFEVFEAEAETLERQLSLPLETWRPRRRQTTNVKV
jgi:hypothetical protein